jgi:hypothetical protein
MNMAVRFPLFSVCLRLVPAIALLAAIIAIATPARAAAPVLIVTPKALSFGKQSWNTTSSTRTVTLKNNSKITITIENIVPSSGFQVTPSGACVGPLAAHSDCSFSVAFQPDSAEAYVGTVAITDDAAHSPQRVKLSGVGTPVVGMPAGHVLVAGGVSNHSAILGTAEIYDPIARSFSSAGTMSDSRAFETATWLDPAVLGDVPLSGTVLISGGEDDDFNIVDTADIYSPGGGFDAAANTMQVARAAQTVTLLTSGPLQGKVLIVGGSDNSFTSVLSAELFDPSTGDFTLTGSLTVPRSAHTATLIEGCSCSLDGDILIAGGYDQNSMPLASAELFDPNTQSFSCVGGIDGATGLCNPVMTNARAEHMATALPNGDILITGGYAKVPNADGSAPGTATADIYHPATGLMETGLKMRHARQGHTATLIEGCNCPLDGAVLIASGADQTFKATTSAELYIPGTGFVTTGSLKSGRVTAGATLFPTGQFAGQVVIIGGINATGPTSGVVLKSAEIYDPITGKFSAAGTMSSARNAQGQALMLP